MFHLNINSILYLEQSLAYSSDTYKNGFEVKANGIEQYGDRTRVVTTLPSISMPYYHAQQWRHTRMQRPRQWLLARRPRLIEARVFNSTRYAAATGRFPHGSEIDGWSEGAHRETSTGGRGRPRPRAVAAVLPTTIYEKRSEGKSTQTHEYRFGQVSWRLYSTSCHH